jgi:restriction system protein
MRRDDGADRWPTLQLSPVDYERAVAALVRESGQEVTDWQVRHLDPVEGVDGTYIIDVTVRFRPLGADYLTLFECKRRATPVKREHVQVLHDKLRSTGAHK